MLMKINCYEFHIFGATLDYLCNQLSNIRYN